MSRPINIANPHDKGNGTAWVFCFGAYGWTRVLAYADHLEDALDECVDWIASNAPGLLADEAVAAEYKRLHAEAVAAGANPDDERVIERCMGAAEVDTTCAGNEGHYLHSWEWALALEAPSKDTLIAYVRGL